MTMKVKLTLSNSAGPLNEEVIEIEDEDDPEPQITDAAEDMLGTVPSWSVGDTFTITELG